MSLRILKLAPLIALAFPTAVGATPVSLSFSGLIVFSGGVDDSAVGGKPFSGTLTFDDDAPDTDRYSDTGTYVFQSPPWSFTVQFGNYAVSAGTSGFEIQVVPDSGLFVTAYGASLTGPPLTPPSTTLRMRFYNELGTLLGSTSLSSISFASARWDQVQADMGSDLNGFGAAGVVQHIEVVPEPGSGALLVLGISLIALKRRPAT